MRREERGGPSTCLSAALQQRRQSLEQLIAPRACGRASAGAGTEGERKGRIQQGLKGGLKGETGVVNGASVCTFGGPLVLKSRENYPRSLLSCCSLTLTLAFAVALALLQHLKGLCKGCTRRRERQLECEQVNKLKASVGTSETQRA